MKNIDITTTSVMMMAGVVISSILGYWFNTYHFQDVSQILTDLKINEQNLLTLQKSIQQNQIYTYVISVLITGTGVASLFVIANRLRKVSSAFESIPDGQMPVQLDFEFDNTEIGKFAGKYQDFVLLKTEYDALKEELNKLEQQKQSPHDDNIIKINFDYESKIKALNRSQAVIEFEPDGKIITANENFCKAVGYSLSEIQGKYHRIFCDSQYTNSSEYSQFWQTLQRGQFQQAEFQRFAKGNKEIWIQASYNPIFDSTGKVVKVVKFASDITAMVKTRQENEKGISEAVFVLTHLSQGDLSHRMNHHYDGDFKTIKESINNTVDRLNQTINQITELSRTIQGASQDISHGAEDLSSRTESQAASIQETVATMEEMSASVRMNADNAGKANGLSRSALKQAETGGEVVAQAVSAMKTIESGSRRITEIVSVIDGIASQTNLLALNAAVEAARAGEAGKGFAVVASEVRSLASRCSDAARDIRALISESNEQVNHGVSLVNATGHALEKIVQSINDVAQTITAISTASREQATGVEEISNTITQMDDMTQKNAALADESATASRNMSRQVDELSEIVMFFKPEGKSSSRSLSNMHSTLKNERHHLSQFG